MIDEKSNYKLSQYPLRIKLIWNAFIKKFNSVEPITPFDRFAFLEFEKISRVWQ
uniref:Uncharacterized protein n=1 Tax=Manihot esculenta TaxID=3983 RepID=A0A2C9VM38_MANES